MKKLFLLICSLCLILSFICACKENETYDYSHDWYLVEECNVSTITYSSSQPWFDGEILVCTSTAQLKNFINLDLDYDDQFFASDSLLLVQFAYAYGEGNIAFEVLTSHDSKLYPVFSFATQAVVGNDKRYRLYIIEVSDTLLSSYETGNILVLNNYYWGMAYVLNDNSKYHRGFKGVFDYYNQNDG